MICVYYLLFIYIVIICIINIANFLWELDLGLCEQPCKPSVPQSPSNPPPSQPGPQPPARFLPWQPIWADAESWGLYFWSSVVSFDSLWVLIYFEINQLLSPKMNEAHTHPQLRGDLELPLQLPPPGFFQLRGPLRVMHFLPVRCFLQLPMVSRRNHLGGACAPQPPRTPHGSRPAPPLLPGLLVPGPADR